MLGKSDLQLIVGDEHRTFPFYRFDAPQFEELFIVENLVAAALSSLVVDAVKILIKIERLILCQ
jgi:hypothetical protein